ncbi:HD-GYP domain-containing protein [Inhella crocodyli]|uniref:HD-GYP domain-containing protein n=1 Tax=Inhella crocodyli TaxID=2499851 RepID=UPI0013E36EAC|nr:HD domain-containing phosphohydrolase [Inhella crocodyli]
MNAPSPHIALRTVQHRVKLGAALPFSVLDDNGRLLLAKGQVIANEDQLESLLGRGALVDRGELDASRRDPRKVGAETLAELWTEALDQTNRMLRASLHGDFAGALDELCGPLLALIERDPDLALFQVVRQEGMGENQYGVRHGVHTGIAAVLAAKRLGASAEEVGRALRVALTMNLSVLELQGRLAHQVFPLKPPQKVALQQHPLESRQMLEANGVSDADWLRAVAEHHETPEGTGYPTGTREPSPLAQLISAADVYTAKLSTRASRAPMPADRAVRDFFLSRKTQPAAAAILKEVGVFPPGTLVQLANGERGVVVRRGAAGNTPIVATLLNKNGEPLMSPARRDTAQAAQAISAVLTLQDLKVRMIPAKLVLVGGPPPA